MRNFFTLKRIAKVGIILISIIIFVWLLYSVFSGKLGAEPGKEIQHTTGIIALRFLIFTLLLSVFAFIFHAPIFNALKRNAGLNTFFWVCLHLLSYLSLELGFDFSLVFSEITSKTYLILGASGFFILFLLAITSTNYSIKLLKKKWKKLHNLVYPATFLIIIHYYLSLRVKTFTPWIYLIILVLCYVLHCYKKYKKS